MIKIENTEVNGFKATIRGMRNPMNSHDKSDTVYIPFSHCDEENDLELAELCGGVAPIIGKNDLGLMKKLSKAGTDHRKYMRMIVVYADVTAPLYWWKEFDTYKVGTVRNSCSTMHKIADKEFTLDDFSHEHLDEYDESLDVLNTVITALNEVREIYVNGYVAKHYAIPIGVKDYWWQLIQLLPSSYNQRATVMLNYEVLANMYHSRKTHKLDEWHTFCDWVESLPYSEIITGDV